MTPSLSPTYTPSENPTLAPSSASTTTPSSVLTNAPSNNPTTTPTTAPTYHPTKVPTTNPTAIPTPKPTTSFPTESPSQSPTRHPITYSNFYYSVNAFFGITGWTVSEISNVNDDIHLFITSLTRYIHEGFDEDHNLEYRYIILNISSLNDYSYDKLLEGDYSTVNETLMQSVNNGM